MWCNALKLQSDWSRKLYMWCLCTMRHAIPGYTTCIIRGSVEKSTHARWKSLARSPSSTSIMCSRWGHSGAVWRRNVAKLCISQWSLWRHSSAWTLGSDAVYDGCSSKVHSQYKYSTSAHAMRSVGGASSPTLSSWPCVVRVSQQKFSRRFLSGRWFLSAYYLVGEYFE